MRLRLGILAAVCGILALGAAAHAQDVGLTLLGSEIPDDYNQGKTVSVLQRAHPEYNALGVRDGVITFFPSLSAGPGYLSNVFGTETKAVGDEYFDIDPKLYVTSDWGRQSVSGQVGANLREFVSKSSEDEQAWYVKGDGRFEVTRDNFLTAGFVSQKLYEERDSGYYPTGAAAPIGYVDSDVYLRGNHESGPLRLVASADFHDFNFDSVAAIGGGDLAENFNDHRSWRVSGRAEYALTSDTAIFGQITHLDNDYTDTGGAQNLSGTENRFLLGTNFDFTALIRGSVGIGYIEREYDSKAFQAVSGLAANARIEYFPTPLITLTGSVQRTVEDSVDFNVGGFFSNVGKLQADYEILRNLIWNTELDYEDDDFRGISRSDRILTVGTGANYNLNRNIAVQLFGSYTDRTSTGAPLGPVFNAANFVVRLNYKI